jgi:VIT1/CCC1 family predicted Fe2+/Mn2+ transporter
MAVGEYVSVRSQREMFEYQIALEREELGLNPDDLGSPWQAASTSFLTFAVGAAVPLLPFFGSSSGGRAIVIAATITLSTLFFVGLGLSLFTGRQALRSALRMVLVGGGAGATTFLLGRAFGVAIS